VATLSITEGMRALRLKLYDEDDRRMVTVAQARAAASPPAPASPVDPYGEPPFGFRCPGLPPGRRPRPGGAAFQGRDGPWTGGELQAARLCDERRAQGVMVMCQASSKSEGWPCMVARMEQDQPDDEKLDEAVQDRQSDVEEMQQRSKELGDRIEEARSDWHSKQRDDAVPGAQPPPEDEVEPPSTKPTP
jgi:hypothetical protein